MGKGQVGWGLQVGRGGPGLRPAAAAQQHAHPPTPPTTPPHPTDLGLRALSQLGQQLGLGVQRLVVQRDHLVMHLVQGGSELA